MADWRRTTRETSFEALSPAVRQAIAAYAERHELAGFGDPVFCAETASTREKRRLFGKGEERQTTSILVTPEFLVWVVEQDGSAVPVAALLREIETREFHSDLVEDTGIEVFGFLLDARERGTAFIGLGPEAAADRVRAAVGDAIGAVR